MIKVRFFNDFQGVETNNVFYPAGEHEVPEHVASRVVKDGRAEYVTTHGTASFENTPQFEEAPVFVPEEKTDEVMTSKYFKRGRK